MLARKLCVVFAATLLGCGSGPSSNECQGLSLNACAQLDGGVPLSSDLVVDSDWLEARLGDPDVQPIDTRGSGYEASRIQGAIHLRPSDLATTVDGVSAQVMLPMEAQSVLRAAGLRNEVTAVVYGGSPEYDPSRIVWTLRYYGHDDVRYLGGGFLRARSELEELYEDMDRAETTVTYCATGQRGSFAWLTLTALGFEDVRLYDGSWNEWGRGGFPVER